MKKTKKKVISNAIIICIIVAIGIFLYWASTTPSKEAREKYETDVAQIKAEESKALYQLNLEYYQGISDLIGIDGTVSAYEQVENWENGDRFRVTANDTIYYFCYDKDDLVWVYRQKGEVKVSIYTK